MRDIDQEIAAKRTELEKLEREKKAQEALSPREQIADMIHGITCHWNHTDGCGYLYSNWQRPCDTRRRYLEAAGRMLAIEPDPKRLKTIFRALMEV